MNKGYYTPEGLEITSKLTLTAGHFFPADGSYRICRGPPRARSTQDVLLLHIAVCNCRSALDRWPNAGKTITWLVIAFEVAFPIGIVLGGWFAAAALAGAAAFQLSIAISMGLNRFTPWFVAAFPATAWTACHYGLFS